MRRGFDWSLAVLGGLALLVSMAGGSLALTQTASGVYEYTDVNQDRTIPVGWPSYKKAGDCVARDSCPHLEGVAFKTVNISKAMQDYETEAQFTVFNGLISQTTYWFAVAYDSHGDYTNWWYDDEASWGLMGELGPDAREIRFFPVQAAPTKFYFSLYVN